MNAIASEISMPMLALIGIGLMYGPISPEMNAIGSSAAMTVKGGDDRRPAHLVDRLRNERGERRAGFERAMAMDVLDDDDRVVDQDADREDEREERHAVEREPPRPRGEERGREREDHRRADDDRLAPPERDEDERNHRQRGESELGDELHRLVVGRLAVVARHRDLDAGGDHGVLELGHAREQPIRHHDRVLAGLLGDGDRDRRKLAARFDPFALRRRAGAEPGIARGLRRAVDDARHVAEVDGVAVRHADHELAHVLRARQEFSCLDVDGSVVRVERARGHRAVGGEQRVADVGRRELERGEPLRLEQHADRASRSADRGHLARARHALELRFQRVGDAFDLEGAAFVVVGPQRERDDRHVVDALGLHERLAHSELLGEPIPVRVDRVVEAHQGFGARHADLELRRHDGQARLRDREDVLEPMDLTDHLLGRDRDQRLHILRRCAGKRDQHVGHGDVDLRLLLARRHHDGERAGEQRADRDQRRQPRSEEELRDASGDAHVTLAMP